MQPFPLGTPSSQDIDTVAVRLLADAPVVRATMGDGGDVWLALSHDAVRQVLSDPRFSREAAMGPDAPVTVRSAYNPDVLTSMDPPKHSRTRRLMSRAFSPRAVDRLATRGQEIVAGLLDDVAAHGPPADLIELFVAPLPNRDLRADGGAVRRPRRDPRLVRAVARNDRLPAGGDRRRDRRDPRVSRRAGRGEAGGSHRGPDHGADPGHRRRRCADRDRAGGEPADAADRRPRDHGQPARQLPGR